MQRYGTVRRSDNGEQQMIGARLALNLAFSVAGNGYLPLPNMSYMKQISSDHFRADWEVVQQGSYSSIQ